MSSPKVSVAIATFNRRAMVEQAIEAVLAQTLPPIEVSVADDASTDDTWGMLQSRAAGERRLRIYRQPRNTGGVANWNRAIEGTTGDYIAWCSDDDRFLPDHLDAAVRFLDLHPDVGFAHACFVDAIETPSIQQSIPRAYRFATDRIFRPGELPWYLIRYYDWPFHPSTIVMRRTVWEQVGAFDPAFALADTDWFVRAAEQFPVALLARHGVLNRRHPGNWSNRLGSARMQREIRRIVEASLHRSFAARHFRRAAWLWLWRSNVRLRLLLTMGARIRSGHGQAAGAAWRQIFDGAGWALPETLLGAGQRAVEAWARHRKCSARDARQSVSPL